METLWNELSNDAIELMEQSLGDSIEQQYRRMTQSTRQRPGNENEPDRRYESEQSGGLRSLVARFTRLAEAVAHKINEFRGNSLVLYATKSSKEPSGPLRSLTSNGADPFDHSLGSFLGLRDNQRANQLCNQ